MPLATQTLTKKGHATACEIVELKASKTLEELLRCDLLVGKSFRKELNIAAVSADLLKNTPNDSKIRTEGILIGLMPKGPHLLKADKDKLNK